jgi:hypothetical protein
MSEPAIYLDDCADSDLLLTYLTNAGYQVLTPRLANTRGASDETHLAYAAQNQYVLVTFNTGDFLLLHNMYQTQGKSHSGIFLIYQDNIAGKDMTAREIVRAIDNLCASGLPIANSIHVLNHWR